MENIVRRGPNTDQGKAVSSRNSIKQGIYCNSLLPSESATEATQLSDALLKEWGASGAEAQTLSQLYVQSLLKTNRLHACEAKLIEVQLHTYESRSRFLLQAGIPKEELNKIPDWYMSSDPQPKTRAIQRGAAVEEAARLLERYSMAQSMEAKALFPNLWVELQEAVLGTRASTLTEWLELLYSQGTPQANLVALQEDFATRFKYDILWARHWRRYEAILDEIRARTTLNLLSKQEWVKVEALQHRRRAEITQQALFLARSQQIEGTQEVSLIESSKARTA